MASIEVTIRTESDITVVVRRSYTDEPGDTFQDAFAKVISDIKQMMGSDEWPT